MTAIETMQQLIADQQLIVTPGFEITGEISIDVRGNTYENRETIKASGFKWDKTHRVWRYSAKPSTDDPVLMAFAREYTEGKIEQAAEEARRAALTDEERERETRELFERIFSSTEPRRRRG